uniref:Uncharacterized protein n=1 Tax=viral metagenome TaxID=1070528 RepID=A0A6M3KSX8_9ZZZZ
MLEEESEVTAFRDVNISDSKHIANLFTDEDAVKKTEQPDNDKKKSDKDKKTTESKSLEDKGGEKKADDDLEEEDEEVKKIKIGDKELTEEEINSALDALKNKDNWQKENTQKSQTIAETKKRQEALTKIWNILQSSPDALRDIQDIIEERNDDELKKAFESAKDFKNDGEFEDPLKNENQELTLQNLVLKAENEILKESTEFKKKYKLKQNTVDEVVNEAIKICEETGKAYSLEEVFKLKKFDDVWEKAKKKEQEDKNKKFADADVGKSSAREIGSQQTRPTSFKDIPQETFKGVIE